MKRVVADWQRVRPNAHNLLRVLRMTYAKALHGAKRMQDAEAQFLKAWPLPSHPLATDKILKERIAAFYASWGKAREAETWRRRAK